MCSYGRSKHFPLHVELSVMTPGHPNTLCCLCSILFSLSALLSQRSCQPMSCSGSLLHTLTAYFAIWGQWDWRSAHALNAEDGGMGEEEEERGHLPGGELLSQEVTGSHPPRRSIYPPPPALPPFHSSLPTGELCAWRPRQPPEHSLFDMQLSGRQVANTQQ